MKSRSFISVLLVTALSFPPLYAEPKSTHRIAVVDLSSPEEFFSERVRIRKEFEKSFAANPGIKLVSQQEIQNWKNRYKPSKSSDEAKGRIKEARELLSRGKKAYGKLNFKLALSLLEESRRQFISNLQMLRSNRDLLDVHLYLGVVYFGLKKEEKAKEEFTKVIYLDPKRELSTRDFSPKVVALFSKVKQEITSQDTIFVRIESNPPGGNMFINGKSVGVTPYQESMLPGEYFVLIEKEGLSPWYQLVNFSRRTQTLRMKLEPFQDEVSISKMFRVYEDQEQASVDTSSFKELGEAVGANIIFLGEIKKEANVRLMGQLYDVRTSDFSKVAVADLESGVAEAPEVVPEMVAELTKLIRPDGYVIPVKPANLSVENMTVGGADRPQEQIINAAPVPEKSWYQHWWIWPFVAAVGVGIFLGAKQLSGSSQSGKIVIDNSGNF